MKFLFFLILLGSLLIGCSKKSDQNSLKGFWDSFEMATDKDKWLDHYYSNLQENVNKKDYTTELLNVALAYKELGNVQKNYNILHKVNKLAKKQGNLSQLGLVNRYLGDYFESIEVLDSSFYYYTKAEKYYSDIESERVEFARVILYKADVLYDMGITTESEVETVRALSILSQNKDHRLTYEATVKMTLILKELNGFASAKKYYDKIPELLSILEQEGYDKENIDRDWLSYYNNIGGYYDKMEDFEKAQSYYKLALQKPYVENHAKLHAMILNNYANSLINSNVDDLKIDSLLKKSLLIREELNHQQGIIASRVRMSEYYLKKKDTVQSLRNMKQAYKLAVETNSNSDVLRILKFLAENEKEEKNYYLNKYVIVKDSLYEVEKSTRNKFARIAYETDEIEKENTILIKRTLYYGVSAIIFLLLILILFIIYRLKLRNRKLEYQKKEQDNVQRIQELLFEQQIASEHAKNEERARIARDLHDSVVNRIFTTRLNLEKIATEDIESKSKVINELLKSEQQIRDISHDIHDNLFHQKQSFSSVLEELVLSQSNSFNTVFKCSVDAQIDWSVLTIQQKTQLFLILQELLQNVNKHSKASNCFVFFIKNEEGILLKVHDDGVGFNFNVKPNGLGLKSIQIRTKKLEGIFEIKRLNNVTISILQIPFKIIN
ncbi:two-component sensor histidine kinase [Flavobacterium sp. xlx-214]|uniref:sensor histidine kinase n=1 Tax=unclassified Flavobacterium TaxID=196869 RepID=UPI0013D4645E|nr:MULTISPECIES: histidine kinase [unclassified Flavobacterium]MBA5793454.1 two-component sensor histidine kinase [Flavobacterium sp. xlx-221]QMI82774.1 two-component sensor histidine kinase [Flavobacterium sp. xlx-214]